MLAALGPDRDHATEEYERLRRRMVRFFALHGSDQPEDLADEAFNRLARKASAGEVIRNVPHYLGGIARLILREEYHNKQRQEQALRYRPPNLTTSHGDGAIDAMECCLEALPREQRNLIERYYSGEGRARIETRRQMARELAISPNALRNRALRIREELEQCFKASPHDVEGT